MSIDEIAMPHKPERYPPDWEAISLRIRERANHCCEKCGVPGKAQGVWVPIYSDEPAQAEGWDRKEVNKKNELKHWRFHTVKTIFDTLENEGIDLSETLGEQQAKVVTIVLTVAHLNHDEGDNRDENLLCLCQYCHLYTDRKDNWRRRKYGKKGQFRGQILLELP